MEDRQLKNEDSKSGCSCVCSAAPFFVGLIVALVFGWYAYPSMMYTAEDQPIRFSHKVHMEDGGMACEDCHSLREDGTFAGLPSTESCAACHSEPLGEDPEEQRFIDEYVNTGKEVKWLVYQTQPDNVFFSHAAHSMDSCNRCHGFSEIKLCGKCHLDVAQSDTTPTYYENKLTGYSKNTMKMWSCERCHATHMNVKGFFGGKTAASNACFVCHK
ncbi:MAG: menaquinone reductase multiheme cytochrome c subunit QrcA [Pseudomonadota bacterium]